MPGELEDARENRLFDGILYKQSRFLKQLRRRRVILTAEKLFSFSEDPEANEDDATESIDVRAIREIIEECYREDSTGKIRYPMTLVIRPDSRINGTLYEWFRARTILLEARTPRERTRWIRAIHGRSGAKITRGPGFKGEHIDQELHGSPFNESDECVICFHPISQSSTAFRLHCNHTFCTPCLYEWAEQQRMCPLCKRMF